VEIENRPEIESAIQEYAGYIASQTLANSVLLKEEIQNATDLDFDEYIVRVTVTKT